MSLEKLLRSAKRSASIDFIKWEDNDTSRDKDISGVVRLGKIATLHDVTPKKWRNLPPEVMSRPLVALEFSIDFQAHTDLPEQERFELSTEIYEALGKRLAPWLGQHINGQVGQVGSTKQYLSEHPSRIATPHINRKRPRRLNLRLPRYVDGKYEDETTYYGLDVRKSTSCPDSPEQSQVKLYYKTLDNKKKLPETQRRVRIEATSNAKALESLYGRPLTVSDLGALGFRDIVTNYLRLVEPKVAPIRWEKFDEAKILLLIRQESMEQNHLRFWEAEVKNALELGNFCVVGLPDVTFKTLPGPTDVLREAVDSLTRSFNGWK